MVKGLQKEKEQKPQIKLTEEQKKQFIRAVAATWQTIGYDVLKCQAETDEIPIKRVRISQSEVIEASLDAGYILTYGGIKEPWLAEYYNDTRNFREMEELAKQALPYKSYSL